MVFPLDESDRHRVSPPYRHGMAIRCSKRLYAHPDTGCKLMMTLQMTLGLMGTQQVTALRRACSS